MLYGIYAMYEYGHCGTIKYSIHKILNLMFDPCNLRGDHEKKEMLTILSRFIHKAIFNGFAFFFRTEADDVLSLIMFGDPDHKIPK